MSRSVTLDYETLRNTPKKAKEPSCAKQPTSSNGYGTNSNSNGVTV